MTDPKDPPGSGAAPQSRVAGRFAKGQSGNPAGRPPKPQKPLSPPLHPAEEPTRQLWRAEALRAVQIRDGEGQADMPTTQAVMRSLSIAAIKGGALAQRTYLHYAHLEDERYRQEREKCFASWIEYRAEARASIAAAEKRGLPSIEWLPHPDDIEFDHRTLEVRFTGAVDEEGKAAQDRIVAIRDISLSLSFFRGEASYRSDDGIKRCGAWLMLYSTAEGYLPKRLRLNDSEFMDRGLRLFGMLRKAWQQEIREQASALGWAPGDLSAYRQPLMFSLDRFLSEREELRLRRTDDAAFAGRLSATNQVGGARVTTAGLP